MDETLVVAYLAFFNAIYNWRSWGLAFPFSEKGTQQHGSALTCYSEALSTSLDRSRLSEVILKAMTEAANTNQTLGDSTIGPNWAKIFQTKNVIATGKKNVKYTLSTVYQDKPSPFKFCNRLWKDFGRYTRSFPNLFMCRRVNFNEV